MTAQSAAEAMVTGINAAGGLNGRRLQAVEYGFNDTDNDFSEDATAACDKFTQDNHVALVLDTGFGTDAGFRDCLRKAGVVDITSGDEGDEAAASQDPLHVNASQSNHDRAYSSVLRGLVANGFVTRSSQLGVVVESCAEDTGPYQQTLVPLIAKLGIKSPVKQTVNCTTGFSSAAADASSINSAILAFRGAGVDRVLFVSGYESLLFLLFAESANSQNYTPGYLLSSTSAPEQIRGQVPQSQWPGMHGVGNFPAIDVDGATPTAVDSRCVKIAAAADVVPSGYGDYAVLYPACSPFLLLEAALRKTNNDTSPQTLMGAINSLGKTFAAPGVLGNSTEITATVHDAPNLGQVFSFDAACTCMHYTGTPMVA